MGYIRRAKVEDISRIAEILIFAKRVHYRSIFHNDKVSFGEMQVLPLAQALLAHPEELQQYVVYDDEFVKGIIHIRNQQIVELYVDSFFEGQGIGSKLIEYAIHEEKATWLWVLEKNEKAIAFYRRHGFTETGERRLEEGTTEYIMKMSIISR